MFDHRPLSPFTLIVHSIYTFHPVCIIAQINMAAKINILQEKTETSDSDSFSYHHHIDNNFEGFLTKMALDVHSKWNVDPWIINQHLHTARLFQKNGVHRITTAAMEKKTALNYSVELNNSEGCKILYLVGMVKGHYTKYDI